MKRSDYTESTVYGGAFTLERYIASIRLAYTINLSDSSVAGSALNHLFQAGYYYPGGSSVQLLFSTGDEVEKPTDANNIISTGIDTAGIWGEIRLDRSWGLIYGAGYRSLNISGRPESNRKYLNLGIKYTY